MVCSDGLRLPASHRQMVIRAPVPANPSAAANRSGEKFNFLRSARIWEGVTGEGYGRIRNR
jgi:hypothetical protein